MRSIHFWRRAALTRIAASVALLLAPLSCALAENALAQDEKNLSPVELLGKRVFEDKSLSEPAGVACASCHDAAKAFQGNNGSTIAAVARGAPAGAFGTRKTPSIAYASFSPAFGFVDKKDEETGKIEKIPLGGQFRDGRAADLAQQMEGPLLNPAEMNNSSRKAVIEKIQNGAYADLARDLFGKDVFADPDSAFGKISQAVAAFESSERFHPFASKFDDFLRGREKLTPLEAKGFALFMNTKKGNCVACHVGEKKSHEPRDWLFTDFSYDALGAPRNTAIPANADAQTIDLGLCRDKTHVGAAAHVLAAAPRGFDVDSLCGAFKAPSLRNVAITGPYMHNGVFTTLREAVAFYATRDTDPAHWYPKDGANAVLKFDDLPKKYHANVNVKEVPYDRKPGRKPRLDDAEIDAIVAFLETLTDRPAQ